MEKLWLRSGDGFGGARLSGARLSGASARLSVEIDMTNVEIIRPS
jgi:hypothetical protein